MLKVGLIEGRHPLPVTEYMMEADIAARVGFHQGLYDAAYFAASRYVLRGPVALYVTGLTVAAIGAVNGLRDRGIAVVVMNYDRETDGYEAVIL